MAPKRPRDSNALGKLIVDIATGQVEEREPAAKASDAAASGRKGGKARADRLTEQRRKEIAKRAATARWGKGQALRGKKEPA